MYTLRVRAPIGCLIPELNKQKGDWTIEHVFPEAVRPCMKGRCYEHSNCLGAGLNETARVKHFDEDLMQRIKIYFVNVASTR